MTEHWVEHPDLVEFYSTNRGAPGDLYPSERRFLPWLAQSSSSVLDVGCAAGGFFEIWRAFAPTIAYTGVDASHALTSAARRLHPDANFLQGDCARGLPLQDRAADTVQALGWLHEEPDYPDALRELWRLTDRRLFVDMRLRAGPQDLVAEQRLALTGEWDGETGTPYIVASWSRLVALISDLRPGTLLGHGYVGRPSATVVGIDESVCFATFVLERRQEGREMTVCLDLPLDWPDDPAGDVTVLPATRLDNLVPPS